MVHRQLQGRLKRGGKQGVVKEGGEQYWGRKHESFEEILTKS